MGEHTVQEDAIKSGYNKALKLIPELVGLFDIVHIYENTNVPFRILKKKERYLLPTGK
ncbi:hypothetical protein [Methanobrevibacter sp.]|uniref:hypothetical protein n=1 Tax=Methanobrevibacter sp. TaxID=66852 RepID=UPI0026E09717|nr:hypothetical protein [Methanobrevibacter sp.]MDO5824356.1 hypothetical protein [Methanobrevibacter sp.]